MRHFKLLTDGYISFIGTGNCGTEITEAEYNNILGIIRNGPTAHGTYSYRLKSDLTWERWEPPVTPEDDDPDLTAEEALDIILGGGANA